MTKLSTLESRDALGLIEEALSLLRRLPFLTYAGLYIGATPFVLCFLMYLLSLTRNPNARDEIVGYAAALTVLYVWLRIWQTVFAAAIWRERAGAPAVEWSGRTIRHVVWAHAVYSPASLVGLVISTILVFPMAWAYAFHQNLCLLALPGFSPAPTVEPRFQSKGRASRPRSLSWEQARLWPGQNHLLMTILSLITVVVFINVLSVLLLLPFLIRFLIGWESIFTRLGAAILYPKVLTAAVALTYLAVAPLVRAVYVLRCFYGLSLKTGGDLLSELHRWRGVKVAAGLLLMVLLLGAPGLTCRAATLVPAARQAESAVSPRSLNDSIDRVLKEQKHAWRAPRKAPQPDEGMLGDVGRAIRRFLDKLADWVGKLLDWLSPESSGGPSASNRKGFDIKAVSKILLVVCVAAVIVLVFRTLLGRRRKVGPKIVDATTQPPDLRQADLSPGQLPEDGWLTLASEMMERGDLRLAIRAVYLAALAFLGAQELVTLTRYKSNRDYLKELQRKARGTGRILSRFDEMVGRFERVWYGNHVADETQFGEMKKLFFSLKGHSGA
jgi:hypothetical protein